MTKIAEVGRDHLEIHQGWDVEYWRLIPDHRDYGMIGHFTVK